MPDVAPPVFAGLHWVAVGDHFEADATPEFKRIDEWAITRFRRIGLRWQAHAQDRSRHVAVFTPRFSVPNIQQVVDRILVEIAPHLERAAQREREKEARQQEAAEASRRDLERWAAEHQEYKKTQQIDLRARLSPVVEEARALLGRFGEFVVRKKELGARIARCDDPTAEVQYADLYVIRDAIRDTKRKSKTMYGGVPSLKLDPVDWPDGVVIEALQLLTALDGDHAQLANQKGWDPKHSSYGHWCCAMLETGSDLDRATALAIGRKIVGHYANRQLLPILSGREA